MVVRPTSVLASGALLAALLVAFPSQGLAGDEPATPKTDDVSDSQAKVTGEDAASADTPAQDASNTTSENEDLEEVPSAASPLNGVSVFVVAKNDASVDGAELLQDMLRSQLENFGPIEIRSRAGEARSISSAMSKNVEDGFRAINDGNEERAVEILEKAFSVLKAHTGPLDKRLMAQSLKGLAVAYAMDGKTKKAAKFIEASLNFWPEQKPLEYAYSKDVFQLFTTVEKARVTTLRASLDVSSQTKGATIYVDGEKQGSSPASVKGLHAGGHWVAVRAEGYQTAVNWIELKAGQPSNLEIELEQSADSEETAQLVSKLASARTKKAATEVAAALANAIGTDKALVISAQARRKGFELKGWALTGEGITSVRKKVGANLMAELSEILSSSLVLTPKSASAETDVVSLGAPRKMSLVKTEGSDGGQELGPQFEESEFYETWWFWTATGGAVLTGVVLGLVLSAEPEVPKGSLNLTLSRVPAR